MIETTELLNFLCKAQQLSACGAVFRQTIDKEGESTWDNGEDYDFYTMNDILDEMLKLQKQKEIKAQKRKELIARLTDEEKELLNLK